LLAAVAAGCSTKTMPVGGLKVRIETDDMLAAGHYRLRLAVYSADRSQPYGSRIDTAVPDEVSWPVTLLIVSNGDATASVALDVTLSDTNGVVDARSYVVDNIPRDTFAELDVVFSRQCVVGSNVNAPSESACCCAAPTGCRLDAADGSDGATGPACAQTGIMAEGGQLADDGPGDSPLDTADAAECEAPSRRCNGPTPQVCGANGQWQDDTGCIVGSTHCVDGLCAPTLPSCAGANVSPSNGVDFHCGRQGGAGDCCAVPLVKGGTFHRSYDGGPPSGGTDLATVSDFRLDAYEVTVGRFRNFVGAVVRGWMPNAGAGKHAHLNRASGLTNLSDSGPPSETGWDASWNAYVSKTPADWDTNLECSSAFTWPDTVELPINCLNWYEAYAFCIWDGGFLPSEAEWSYAAAGGAEQRQYPWGWETPGNASDLAVFGCHHHGSSQQGICLGQQDIAFVGFSTGVGQWGQWDLAGNVAEWTIDWSSVYVSPSVDSAALSGGKMRIYRGGGFDTDVTSLRATSRASDYPTFRYTDVGVRCARVP
jgi:formylglycine-generating enzyme required for sulfatase activity